MIIDCLTISLASVAVVEYLTVWLVVLIYVREFSVTHFNSAVHLKVRCE